VGDGGKGFVFCGGYCKDGCVEEIVDGGDAPGGFRNCMVDDGREVGVLSGNDLPSFNDAFQALLVVCAGGAAPAEEAELRVGFSQGGKG